MKLKKDEKYVHRNYTFFIFGFKIESIVFPIRTKANPVNAINAPGGINHHHKPLEAAAAV